MTTTTVVLNINQQQRPIIDRLLATGRYGATPAEVLRHGFLAYCRHTGVAPSSAGEGASS